MLLKQIIENQVRYIFIILSVFIISLTVISCKSSDDEDLTSSASSSSAGSSSEIVSVSDSGGYIQIESTNHSLDEGDVIRFTTTDTLPAGLALATDYYVVGTQSTNTFFVSATESGTPIAYTDGGTGTHSWQIAMSSDGLFVTVGNVGTILTSSDGISWTERTSGTTNNLYGVTYGGGLVLTVGDNGTILTSSDGSTWTSRTSGITDNLYGVTYGGGLFVTVGYNGTILTSSDGTTWANTSANKRTTLRYFSKPDAPHLYGVTYGDGLFVTVGGNATVFTSSDGTTWTENGQKLRSNWVDGQYFKAVTYRKKLFVLVGRKGKIMNSPDGITWKKRKAGTGMSLMGVTYSPTCGKVEWKGWDAGLCKNGIFVTVGKGGKILTSFDGNWWVKRTFKGASWIYAVTYGNGTFVTAGANGVILTSFDGISWLRRVTGNKIKSKGIDNIRQDVPTGYLDIRSPGHNLDVGDVIRFTTTGTLPAVLALNTDYYVVATPSNKSFFVSETEDGTPINLKDCMDEEKELSTNLNCKGTGTKGSHRWHYSAFIDDEREEEDTEEEDTEQWARTSFAVPSVTIEDLNAITYSDQL